MTEGKEITFDAVPEEKGVINTGEEAEKEEKLFTQSQLEKMISERLQRERKQNEALKSVKQVLRTAKEKGFLESESYADLAKELITKLKNPIGTADEVKKEKSFIASENTSFVAEEDGNDYDKNIGKTTDEKESGDFFEVLERIKSKYPEEEVRKVFSGDSFYRFAKGKSGRTEDIFDEYFDFMSNISGQASKDEGSDDFVATAFSDHSGVMGMSVNLSKTQMEMAKSAGMSYREYKELIESIPKRGARRY